MPSLDKNLSNNQKLENRLILDWIYRYDIKTEDGVVLDWYDHNYMMDIYDEMASCKKNIVCYKAAQVTFSTAAILSTLWISKNKGIDIIYTLPTNEDVRQFAGGKINRIIAQNPILQSWVKEKDTVEQKTVGNNIIYYRGSWSQKTAMMVSSDLNIYDEVDTSDQRVIEQYATRLQHSDLKLEWYFSHPSVPGNGVSKHWHKSDQRHWFIQCEHCDKWQYMSFPESFDMENEEYICKKCKGVISDDVRRNGKWVKKYKDKEMAGFWIPLFICPWVSAKEIIGYYRDKPADYFWNKVLGLPYVGSGNKIVQRDIFQNLTDKVNLQESRPIIGVDTGIEISYVIGNKKGLFYYGSCNDYDEIESYLKRWKNAIVIADQGGDLIGIRKLREKYLGRVFLCHYREDRRTMELISWGKNDEEGNVVVDRNRMIQLTIDEFKDGRIPISGNETDWYDYWLHWNNIYRVSEENNLGVKKRKWKRSGADHWVHSTIYWRVGMDRFGEFQQGAVIGADSWNLKESPSVSPDGKMKAPNPKSLFKFKNPTDDWRKR